MAKNQKNTLVVDNENVEVENVVVENIAVTTDYKVTVKNGSNLISFEVKNVVNEGAKAVEFLATEVILELENLHNTNVKLKSLGYKGNFFSFTTGRKCILSIEAKKETENFTFAKKLEFSFAKLEQLTDPIDGLNCILGATVNRERNNVLIGKVC